METDVRMVSLVMAGACLSEVYRVLEMWVNAQRDGRPAEYRWRSLFNAAKFG